MEWGFPSEAINASKYNAEDCAIYDDDYNIIGNSETVASGVGRCSVETLQELLDEHGGIDIQQTIDNINCKYN